MKIVKLYRIKSIYPKTIGEVHTGLTLMVPTEGEEFLLTALVNGATLSTLTSTIKKSELLSSGIYEFTTLDSTYRLTILQDFGDVDPESFKED